MQVLWLMATSATMGWGSVGMASGVVVAVMMLFIGSVGVASVVVVVVATLFPSLLMAFLSGIVGAEGCSLTESELTLLVSG
jgi:hypothetical protein